MTRTLALAVSATLLAGAVGLHRASAQSATADWEKAAGVKMAFDVASVKQDKADPSATNMQENVPLDAGNGFTHTGGLFRATNIPLHWYIRFAYKLGTMEFSEIMEELPGWALTNRYDIDARATGDATKDQYRLMMQGLLADRFKLAVHFETKQMPIWGLVLDKPGRLGPKLKKHSADPPCPGVTAGGGIANTVDGGFPLPCYAFFEVKPNTEGNYAGGSRNVPMSKVADILSLGAFQTYKPVVDKTGLNGNYDFVIEFSRDPNSNGPAFADALKEQLGLKLVPQKGPIETVTVDHIERPSAN